MISTSDALYLSIIIRTIEEFNVLKKMLIIISNIKSQELINRKIEDNSKMIKNLLHSSDYIKWPEDANTLLNSWIDYHQRVLRFVYFEKKRMN